MNTYNSEQYHPVDSGDLNCLDVFWHELAKAESSLLLLDYDGTLAPFRVERDQAVPYPGIIDLLSTIRNYTTTRLIIISGRAIDDILPLIGLNPPPEIWGCHGWERLAIDGRRAPVDMPIQAQAGLNAAEGWCLSQGLQDYMERKPASLAIHWRGLEPLRATRLRKMIIDGWQTIGLHNGLEIHDFNGGLELRCPGKDKGTTIVSILDSISPHVPAAFLGDDLTDEDGFKAIHGRGLGILVNKTARSTHAKLRIVPPDGLLDFLKVWSKTAKQSSKDLS